MLSQSITRRLFFTAGGITLTQTLDLSGTIPTAKQPEIKAFLRQMDDADALEFLLKI